MYRCMVFSGGPIKLKYSPTGIDEEDYLSYLRLSNLANSLVREMNLNEEFEVFLYLVSCVICVIRTKKLTSFSQSLTSRLNGH